MPWTLKAAVTQDAALAERCKQVPARVRDCKRAPVRDAHCQTPDRRFNGDDAGAPQLRAGDQAVQTRTARRASGSGRSWCRGLGAFRGTSLRRSAFRAGALRRDGRGVELDDADIAAAVCSRVDCGWCHVHLHVLRLTNADDTATYPDRCRDARRAVCAQSLTCTAGSSTVNSVPRRGSEATVTDPPCASTTCLTIASPSPEPSPSRGRAVSAFQKRSKMRGRSAGATPIPVSRQRSTTRPAAPGSATTSMRPELGVNFI